MIEFTGRQENQPEWGEDRLCSYCDNEFLKGYYYNDRQVACESCVFDYIEFELFINERSER